MWEGSERQTQQVASDLFLFKWLQSLFAQCFPIDTLARLWDRFLYEGTGFLFRTALAILRLLQPVIEKMPLEDTIALLTCNVRMKRVWNETVSRDALFAAINRIRFSDKRSRLSTTSSKTPSSMSMMNRTVD